MHDVIPVMWALLPYLCNCNEMMALWLLIDFQFFLFIPMLLCVCVQALQRGNQAFSFPRWSVRGFIITMNTLDVISPVILILRSSQGTSALVDMTSSLEGSNRMIIVTLDLTP